MTRGDAGRLGRHCCAMAAVAVLNPYTLFGRDTGTFWLAAFVLPVLLSAAYAIGRRGPRAPTSAAAKRFVQAGLPLVAVVLMLQWADV
ncbi:hypothetical protein V4F39_26815 [Aquincola sp. MAHUQ-54]|uniref:Uncharacterized protein n=1 Tax=Aquincola agrisoli TaxID=3119538 RepID=A0AAW9QEP3_9BURK